MSNYATAHVVDEYGAKMAIIKVPVALEGPVPEIPKLVEKNGWFAYLKDTNPLTYVNAGLPTEVEVIEVFRKEPK